MAGETFQLGVMPNVADTELPATKLTSDEIAIFERDFPRVVAPWSLASKGMLNEVFARHKQSFIDALQIAKHDLSPGGAFGGVNATKGFGMTPIRPDYLVPIAQARMFQSNVAGVPTALAALTTNNWYGMWHNAILGAAWNANPLFMRADFCVAICGFLDVSGNPMAEEIQMERDGDLGPIWVPNYSFLGGDYAFFELPRTEFIAPRKQFRFQFKTNAIAGTLNLLPVGVAYVAASTMRSMVPVQPTQNPP